MDYLIIKWLHIISATILFGTGLGSAFYKLITDRNKNIFAIAMTNRIIVLADWIFTTPTIFIQPLTGFILLSKSGYALTSSWLILSMILFIIAGSCWIPVVFLQIKMRDISNDASNTTGNLPDIYWHHATTWFYLGIPAFISILGVFYLMTNKPILF